MPYAQVRGVNLYYEDRGQGQPLLLIPGALGTGQSDFAPQLEALPDKGLRVIAPDARGYGNHAHQHVLFLWISMNRMHWTVLH